MPDEEFFKRLRELEQASAPLDPDPQLRDRLRAAVIESSERFLEAIGSAKAFEDEARPALGLLDTPIGEEGLPIETVIDRLERDVVHPGGHPASPGHLAYLSGGGIYHAALADFLAAVGNKFAGLFFTGPGPVRMENMLLRWVADLVGYPATAGGSLASGGSLANLTAIVAARDAHGVKGANVGSAVVYLTARTHHSIEKALRITGLSDVRIHEVPIDDQYRMRSDALAEAVATDRAAGLRPWLIVATAGNIDTGAVDPLDAVATVAEREGCWFHVDAAYGGFFMLTQHGRDKLAGIERSDSVALDPHKSLFVPWGTGVILVRDTRTLLTSHSLTGAYLQDAPPDPSEVSPADVSPELTKPFRALRLWLPLVLLGTKPFRAALEEKLLLARYFREQVHRLGFEVGPPPDLSVVTFRWAPPRTSPGRADEINRAIVDGMRRDGRIFLSSTMLNGCYTIRLAVLPFRTHLRTIELALDVLREQLEGQARPP